MMNNEQRKYLIIAVIITWMIGAQQNSFAQTETSLEGIWMNEPRTRKLEFYREGGEWLGKLIWVEDNSKVKTGDILFKEMVWKGKQFIGKAMTQKGTVNCIVLFERSDKIRITASRGGMSKSVYWSRVK